MDFSINTTMQCGTNELPVPMNDGLIEYSLG